MPSSMPHPSSMPSLPDELTPVRCPTCGVTFVPTHRNQRYCQAQHRLDAQHGRYQEDRHNAVRLMRYMRKRYPKMLDHLLSEMT